MKSSHTLLLNQLSIYDIKLVTLWIETKPFSHINELYPIQFRQLKYIIIKCYNVHTICAISHHMILWMEFLLFCVILLNILLLFKAKKYILFTHFSNIYDELVTCARETTNLLIIIINAGIKKILVKKKKTETWEILTLGGYPNWFSPKSVMPISTEYLRTVLETTIS